MKFIHISDVHIGYKPDIGKTWSNTRQEEIKDTFMDLIKVCEAEEIDLLLIAGNLFDKAPDEKLIKEIDFRLRQLSWTKTVIIAGDCDYIDSSNPWNEFQFSANVNVLKPDEISRVYINEIGVCVTGMSYGKKTYSENILETIKPERENVYNILLGHGGFTNYMPFDKNVMVDLGFNYIALGHSNKPSHMVKNKMAYSGSLEPLSVNDTGKRGYLLGEVNDGKTTIKFVPFSKRNYVNMNIKLSTGSDGSTALMDIETQIQKNGTQHIYSITIEGNTKREFEIDFSGIVRSYNIYEIVDKTQSSYDVNVLLNENDNNILGEFIKALIKKDNFEERDVRYKALKYGIDALLEDMD